jgi:hypothetical protein
MHINLTVYSRNLVVQIKAMLMLTFIIQPWPPTDFGMLVDSLTFASSTRPLGVLEDGLALYSKAIFGKDTVIAANFTPKVAELTCMYCFFFDL